mmetsp:Transcript_20635/g.50874  ORF Transcript_20635/g.50874 Transcript_20635/m.50874 type:complete len:363 (-) Transcript_20635:512-1600(-)
MKHTHFNLCLVPLLLGVALAHQRYVSRFPNGNQMATLGCRAFGHNLCSDGASRTSLGNAFRAQGYAWTLELCLADSDGDGVSNGQEMGDPCCVWKVGDVPAITDLASLSIPDDRGSTTVVRTNCSVDGAAGPTFTIGNITGGAVYKSDAEIIAHGVIMSLAFMTFYPVAFLCIRFGRRHFPMSKSPGGVSSKPFWFFSHMVLNIVAVALVIAGFIVIEVYRGAFLATKNAHSILGFVILVFALLQTSSAMLARPAPDSPWRKTWYMVHVAMAVMIAVCGAANVFLGIQELENRATASLYAVAGIWLGAVILGGVGIEVFGRMDGKPGKKKFALTKAAVASASVVAAFALVCGVAISVLVGVF